MIDLQTNWSSNCRPLKRMISWDSCRAVFGAYNCAKVCWWWWRCILRLLLFLSDVSFKMCIMNYKIPITCLLRTFDTEVDVRLNLNMCIVIQRVRVQRLKWSSTKSSGLVWLSDETRKVQTRFNCNICNVPGRWWFNATLNQFFALCFLFFSKYSLSIPVSEPSADDFVINSIFSRAAVATCLWCSSSNYWISNSLNCICFSISRQCLPIRSTALYCFSSSSLLNFHNPNSCWGWLDLF